MFTLSIEVDTEPLNLELTNSKLPVYRGYVGRFCTEDNAAVYADRVIKFFVVDGKLLYLGNTYNIEFDIVSYNDRITVFKNFTEFLEKVLN